MLGRLSRAVAIKAENTACYWSQICGITVRCTHTSHRHTQTIEKNIQYRNTIACGAQSIRSLPLSLPLHICCTVRNSKLEFGIELLIITAVSENLVVFIILQLIAGVGLGLTYEKRALKSRR
jgi:hypothetical protein